jgi:hypothetical protein
MAGTFEIKKAKDGEFYFHLKAPNGQVILASEMYKQSPPPKTASHPSRRTPPTTAASSAKTPKTANSCSTSRPPTTRS